MNDVVLIRGQTKKKNRLKNSLKVNNNIRIFKIHWYDTR